MPATLLMFAALCTLVAWLRSCKMVKIIVELLIIVELISTNWKLVRGASSRKKRKKREVHVHSLAFSKKATPRHATPSHTEGREFYAPEPELLTTVMPEKNAAQQGCTYLIARLSKLTSKEQACLDSNLLLPLKTPMVRYIGVSEYIRCCLSSPPLGPTRSGR